MKKIALLGVENSHAKTFLQFHQQGRFPEVEVYGVYSEDIEACKKLNDEFGVKIMETLDEAVGKVDGVIITARHGAKHYAYAKPYIATCKAMFIDKPITIDEDEAVAFMRELKEAGVRINGGSALQYIDFVKEIKDDHAAAPEETIGGLFRAPILLGNPNGGFFFYAQHLAQLVMTVFGNYPKSVSAHLKNDCINVVFHYDNFNINGIYSSDNFYQAGRFVKNGAKIQQLEVRGDSECFFTEFEVFYDILLGKKEQEQSYKDFIAPVFVLNAINRAMQSGKQEPVMEYDV